MFYQMDRRPYTLKERAKLRDAVRDRIVEATMALHESAGPRDTTISAIAKRAGVQRLTVYRHFPDDAALFAACTGRWIALHPPPAADLWRATDDPIQRCRTALEALYTYYRETERMWALSFRDEAVVPALKGPIEAFRAYLDGVRSDLLAAFAPPPGEVETGLAALLGHAMQFSTWASLAREDLDEGRMAALVTAWIDAVRRSGGSPLP